VREVVALDQHRPQPPARGIQRQPDAGDSATDHQHVDHRIIAQRSEFP
jgi:hypothetical protein